MQLDERLPLLSAPSALLTRWLEGSRRLARGTLRHAARWYLSANCVADRRVDISSWDTFTADRFPDSGPSPWLDGLDAEMQVGRRQAAGSLTRKEAELCRQWSRDGYVILEGLLRPKKIQRAWKAYERAVRAGSLAEGARNPHAILPEVNELLCAPKILKALKLLLGREPLPFQTQLRRESTGRRAHSDAIEMASYPLGYLVGASLALEDVRAEAGPLRFYPGSHRLPYLFSREAGISPREFNREAWSVVERKYEPIVRRLIDDKRLTPKEFRAKQGDVILWHANLLHDGGEKKHARHTRKHLVCHYFFQGTIAYHDVSGSLANTLPARAYWWRYWWKR